MQVVATVGNKVGGGMVMVVDQQLCTTSPNIQMKMSKQNALSEQTVANGLCSLWAI